jgi:hypothetical protein
MNALARLAVAALAYTLAVSVGAEPGPAWRNHDKPWPFLFANHLDSHQQSKLNKDGELEGYLYIWYSGETTDDGYRVALHVECNAVADGKKGGCVAGWKLYGVAGSARFLFHADMDHPFWYAPRAAIPQPGAFGHFHWTGAPMSDELPFVNPPDNTWPGYFLELDALDTFCFVHHAIGATGTCENRGGVVVSKGIDLATHLNIVPVKVAPLAP